MKINIKDAEEKTKTELRQFMKARKYFGWYVNNPKEPGDSPVELSVECTLSDGTWDDIQALIKIIGISAMAEIFRKNINKWRPYFRPIEVNYLTLYFNKHSSHLKSINKI